MCHYWELRVKQRSVNLIFQIINFSEPFYEPPNVLTTAVKDIKNNSSPLCAVKGPLSSWVEVRSFIITKFQKLTLEIFQQFTFFFFNCFLVF